MAEHAASPRRPRAPLALLLGLFVLFGAIYAFVTPPFENPDEASHFLYLHNLANSGQLPVIEDRATMMASLSVQRHHPPLYYLLGAALVSGLDRSDSGLLLQANPFATVGTVSPINANAWLHPLAQADSHALVSVRLLRLVGVLMGAGTVWLAYRAGRALGGRESAGLASGLFVAVLPGFIFISASVTNDTLVTFLSSAAIVLLLESWRARAFGWKRGALLGLIVGGVALTKINGLAIVPVVGLWTILALVSRRLSLRALIGPLLLAAGISAGLSLWWAIRNIQLYGDPLAMGATLGVWGRGPVAASWDEASGVWDSFWMVLGQFNVRGPDWFYRLYAPALAISGIGCTLWAARRRQTDRWLTVFLVGAGLIGVVALIAGTSRLNVSQGRILFPVLVAFAPLVIVGLRRIAPPAVTALALAPLILAAVTAPLLVLQAYPGAQRVAGIPAYAAAIGADTGGLRLEAASWPSEPVRTGDALDVSVFLSGNDSRNPFLTLRAVHPVTQDVLGSVNVYPGMQPTGGLADGALREARLRLPITGRVNEPTQVQLLFGWEVLGATAADPSQRLPLDLAGTATDTVRLAGPVLLPDARSATTPAARLNAVFGDALALEGVTVDAADDSLGVTLALNAIRAMDADYTLTLGVMGADGQVLVQADGPVAAYPTRAWLPGVAFTETRSLDLPRPLETGDTLFIGWYDPRDGTRLSVNTAGARDNLLFVPLDT